MVKNVLSPNFAGKFIHSENIGKELETKGYKNTTPILDYLEKMKKFVENKLPDGDTVEFKVIPDDSRIDGVLNQTTKDKRIAYFIDSLKINVDSLKKALKDITGKDIDD
ncbi:MAG: hypothetical protein A2104_09865 [Candidatus Melainabacteria bacterium GWF2_32_7]|nr:MAG: hypothetical protein A2104_09865 [Candidatus Melainabacteria bacterium GWF2_32_7]